MPHYRAASPARPVLSATLADAGLATHGERAGAVLFAAALTGAASQLSLTVPWTAIPFTMQPIAVLLAGAVLGARLGALSQVLYLALGVTGASMFALSPVLAPGVARLLGPTGGFLLMFPLAAFTSGWLADRGWTRSYAGAVATLVAGLVVLYAGGASWLAALAGPASVATLWPFVAADLVKAAAGGGGAADFGAGARGAPLAGTARSAASLRPKIRQYWKGRNVSSQSRVSPARAASRSITVASTRSVALGPGPESPGLKSTTPRRPVPFNDSPRFRNHATRSSISWTTPTTRTPSRAIAGRWGSLPRPSTGRTLPRPSRCTRRVIAASISGCTSCA